MLDDAKDSLVKACAVLAGLGKTTIAGKLDEIGRKEFTYTAWIEAYDNSSALKAKAEEVAADENGLSAAGDVSFPMVVDQAKKHLTRARATFVRLVIPSVVGKLDAAVTEEFGEAELEKMAMGDSVLQNTTTELRMEENAMMMEG